MRKIILTITLALLLISGCNEVQLSPRYQQALEMSAINVRAMCDDCKAGNQESCVKGLEAASKLLDHIVDASYGKESE